MLRNRILSQTGRLVHEPPAFASTLGPSAYWYLARGTGAVALVLLTASVVLGILGSVRFAAARWPRFAIDAVHRDISLLVLVVLVIHIVTSVLDGFAPITLLDGVIPFNSPYRPLWLGLGTLSFDLLVAIAVTSLVRRRLGYRAWRAVHWLAYASWPVAVLHGLGTGSDVKQWWMLAPDRGVHRRRADRRVGADRPRVGADHAGAARAGDRARGDHPDRADDLHARRSAPARLGARAGTPAVVAGQPAFVVLVFVAGVVVSSRAARSRRGPLHREPRPARVTPERGAGRGGRRPHASVSGRVHGRLRVRIGGEPIGGGGLSMTGSQVDLALAGRAVGAPGHDRRRSAGPQFSARVPTARARSLDLHAMLQIDDQSNTVTGTLSGAPG